jgi:serine/threonine protein phosphatase 1
MTTASRISRIRRCLRLPRNANGRDLVVGDLHGHRSLLEEELARLGFDPARDRVLSVGDLINRGPESLATLALIEEPWFHAVLGNHELMLLNYLDCYSSRIHCRKTFPAGAGEWINEALARNRKLVARLADRIAALPLALHVESEPSFNVMHGDLHPIGSRQESLFCDATVCVHEADQMTTSRANIGQALKADLCGLRFAEHSVRISETPVGDLPITYVGHSRLRHVTVHRSYVYIDQGVCMQPAKPAGRKPPTVLDPIQFAYWLRGVTAARERAAAVRRLAESSKRSKQRAGHGVRLQAPCEVAARPSVRCGPP